MALTTPDMQSVGTAGWWVTAGPAPSTPTLALADNGDGTGAVATVAGSDAGTTNTIYTAPYGSDDWTDSGDRSGDGAVALTLSAGYYWAYVSSASDAGTAASAVESFVVSDSDSGWGPEHAVRKLLMDDADIAGAVAARAYPFDHVPQGAALPFLALKRVDNVHEKHMSAASGLAAARIQISGYAETYAAARALAELLREALDGYSGSVTGAGGTCVINRISLEGDYDGPAVRRPGSESEIAQVIQDYEVWHEETVPTF